MTEVIEENSLENVVEYDNVTLSRSGALLLENVNLKVGRGEFVYLIGKVGSGKSTLLKSMYGEMPVSSGNATVLNMDLATVKSKSIPLLRRKIGIVFQDFQLLHDRDVWANLQFVLEATGWRKPVAIKSKINEVLVTVGMTGHESKLPHELSGGEQQRIAIARALLNSPSLILADEPTGNLDSETADQIVKHLHDISNAGTAVIMATHNISFANRFPGRILRCINRTISEI